MKVLNRLTNITLAIVMLLLVVQVAVALEVREPTSGPPGLSGKPVGKMAKVSTALREALMEFDSHTQQGRPADTFAPGNRFLQVSRGRIMIDAVAAGDVNVLLQDLKALGLENEAQYGVRVSGMMPLGKIRRLLSLDSLRSAAATWRPITNVGAVTSEGVTALRADEVHSGNSLPPYTGLGVKIGVLSDSYAHQTDSPTATDDQASGDLPPAARIDILDDSANCGSIFAPAPCSDEGRAIMQLVHDVAPGADLIFQTAVISETHFANGIQQLADNGANIIVDDVLYFTEPMFQDGIVAQAVNNVVSQGVAYFSSAGNNAKKSYESDFVGSGERLTVLTGWLCPWICQEEDRGELHDFASGPQVDSKQSITIPADRTIIITMQWAQPFGSLGGSGSQNDFDMYLVDADFNIIASSITDNISTGDPVEILQFTNSGTDPVTHDLLITHFAGPAANTLVKYVIFRGIGLSSEVTAEYLDNDRSTLYGHANAAGSEAVGAVFWETLTLEPFSSRGGTPILFGPDGTPTYEVRNKPEVLGPDGTNTTFFYSDYDGDGWPNFYGTSASAPHVAAVAALLLEAKPDLFPAQIYDALEMTAVPIDGQSNFYDYGYGLVDAVEAVAYVTGTDIDPPLAYPDGPYVVDEGAILNINGVLDNDTDPNGNPVTATTVAVLDTPPVHAQTFTLNDDGTFTYVHDGSETTTDSFTYHASDGGANSDPAMVTIAINAVNDPPVADSQTVSTTENTSVSITLSGSDADSVSLTYTVVTGPSHGALSGTAPDLTYTPNADYNGADSFSFKANDGSADSNVATVSVTVTPVNDPPVADAQSVATLEDNALAITLSGSDADGDALTYTVVTGPSHGALSGTAPNLTYTPVPGYNGGDGFTFTVNDGTVNSTLATVSVTVTPVNDPPVADAQSVSTAEDTALTIILSGSDADGDALAYTVVANPSNGVLSGTAPNLTYTPSTDYNGGDSFSFQANDGSANSNVATVSITVTPVNDPPVADDQDVGTNENTSVPITLSGSDADGDALTYTVVTGPSNGALSGTAPDFTYTPDAGYSGADSFTFKANDGSSDSNVATVTITVNPVAQSVPPYLQHGIVAASTDSWVTVTLAHDYGNNMVVVATPNYDDSSAPVVTRIQNASGTRFQVMLERTAGTDPISAPVHWMVVEEGVYNVTDHGVKMEAHKFISSVTNHSGSKSAWQGETRSYSNTYSQPVVIGQVMTYNDIWSVFWSSSGYSHSTPPNGSLRVGKHVGEDPILTRLDETVGYIVIEAGSGIMGTTSYVAALGTDTIRGMSDSPPYTYTLPGGLTAAATAVLSQAAMDGPDGSWPILYGANPVSTTTLWLAVDEDQAKDSERRHTHEQVGYIVFGN